VKLNKLEALMAETSASTGDVALMATSCCCRPIAIRPSRKTAAQEGGDLRSLAAADLRPGAAKTVADGVRRPALDGSTSQQALDLVIRQIEHLPVLLIATFRHEFVAPWTNQAHVTLLTSTD